MTLTETLLKRYKVHPLDEPPVIIAGSRWNFLPALLSEFGLVTGAEIGVQKGMFSQRLCQKIPGLRLFSIDPWVPSGYYKRRYSQRRMDGWYARTIAVLAPYNATVIRALSAEAVAGFEDGSLDFVFIDADHDFDHVSEDLRLWTPKVRLGGVISGHDYYNSRDHSRCRVKDAVDAWTASLPVPMWFVFAGEEHRAIYLWERT